MQELLNVAQFIQNYISALSRAIDNTALMISGIVRQEIETQARNKLSTSREEYISALSVKVENYVLIMELDEKNWLACAVEKGATSWDMNQTHLKSPKAKISKQGHRYMSIPIAKEAGGKAGPSERSKEIQRKINEVMQRPSFKTDKVSGSVNRFHTKFGDKYQPGIFSGGPIVQTQQINTGMDKDISGLYRTRVFANSEEFYQKQANKKGMPKWSLVMFRTMSENPLTKHWIHPGITGINLLQSTNQNFVPGMMQRLLDENIKAEMRAIGLNI
jgi:hypothetical protein